MAGTPETLPEFADYAAEVLEDQPEMNEANTRYKLLNPLFNALGWSDTHDVEPEYPVSKPNGVAYVDYAFLVEKQPAVFVEAKAAGVNLSESDRSQLEWYLKQSNVDWGLLTNGRQYVVVRRVVEGTTVRISEIASVSFDELRKGETPLDILSKETITSGNAQLKAQRAEDRHDLQETLSNSRSEAAEAIAETMVETLQSEAVRPIARREAQSYLDRIEEVLDQGPAGGRPFWDVAADETGIVLSTDGIRLPEEKSAAQALVDFVEFLFEHGFLTVTDLPVETGRKRNLIHSEPTNQVGGEMIAPQKVSGVYVETNFSRSKIKDLIKTVGNSVTHSTDDG